MCKKLAGVKICGTIIKSERDVMNMSDAITLNYYNSNAAVFSETTKNVDFSEVQQIFTKHLSPDASILDFGCGSDVIQSIF